MARSKNKRKNKKQTTARPKLSLKNYIIKVARKLPLHECLIFEGWEELGKTQLVVSRRKPNGNIIIGFYMVDLWCMGLKDTFYREAEEWEYEEIKGQISRGASEDDFEVIRTDPEIAFNVIYGAIEYAEDLGFSPAKEFAVTEYILDDVEQIPFVDITFGKDGRPLYTSGPDDNVDRILKTLDKFVGKGNYNFIADLEEFGDLDDFEIVPDGMISKSDRAMKKMDALMKKDEHQAMPFLIQLMTTDMALGLTDGALENLPEVLEASDKVAMYERITEFLAEGPDDKKIMQDEEMKAFIKMMIEQTLNQISAYGDAEFLFKPDYVPVLDEISFGDLGADLTEQKIDDVYFDLITRMSDEQQFDALARMNGLVAITALEEKGTDLSTIDEATFVTLKEEVIERLEEQYDGLLSEEDLDNIHSILKEIIQKYKAGELEDLFSFTESK